jgi:hypothetical protein
VVFFRMPVPNPARAVPLIALTVVAAAPGPDAVTSPVSEVIALPEADTEAQDAAVVPAGATHTNIAASPVEIVLIVFTPEDTTVTSPLDELDTCMDQP